MKKQPRIDGFFKRKHTEISAVISSVPDSNIETVASENRSESPRIETTDNEVDNSSLERDPGLRPQIWNYPVNQRDEIRRAYINAGPYQPILSKYPKSGSVTHQRSFQSSWFKLFPSWLEYSPVKDAAFCLPCYLFNKPSGHSGKNAFTLEGFQSWKKVRDGKNCSFLNHEGKDPNSPHKIAEISCLDLMNQSQHLQKVVENYSSQQIADNRLRLKATIEAVRGQGYDGASNMRGEWNGLQALILNDCSYAYYVHCLAHRLQLALIASSREVIHVHHFFTKLTSIVNIVGASCKRNDELKNAQAAEIEHMIAIDELETGKGMNQIGTLQRAELMEITNDLCQALQCQSQDIINAMNLVSSTKALIQELRDDGWDSLLTKVNFFCEARNIDILDMNARYVARRGRARHQQDDFTIKHYYMIDIFYAAIDSQLQELNSRFSDQTTELLILGSALDPREVNKSFRIDDICQLVDKFYPQDFEDHEKIGLRRQLQHFESDVVRLPEFKNLSTISDLSQWMVTTRRSMIYPLVYRVLVLVLTLPVSTATAERSFSAMRIVKTRLRNKMEDEFLTDSLIMYIEREIAEKFSIDSIIDDFRDMKEQRVLF
ncbi:unnamed protein product [Prunus brigantina]